MEIDNTLQPAVDTLLQKQEPVRTGWTSLPDDRIKPTSTLSPTQEPQWGPLPSEDSTQIKSGWTSLPDDRTITTNDADGNVIPIINPQDRKEELSHRKRDLDNEIQKLNKEEKKLIAGNINKSTYGLGVGLSPGTDILQSYGSGIDAKINEIRARKASLQWERLSVKKLTDPLDNKMLKEISDGTTSDIKVVNGEYVVNKIPDFNSILKKYPISKINEADNDSRTQKIEKEEREIVKTFEQTKIPEGMFTFSAFKYGSRPATDTSENEDLVKEWEKMIQSGAWNGKGSLMPIDRNGRIKVAMNYLKNYVDNKFKDAEPEVRKNRLFEYSKIFGGLMNVNQDGSPSVEGLQGAALDRQSNIDTRWGEISTLHTKLKQLKRQGKLNGQDAYLEWVGEEEKKLTTLKEFNENILKLPVRRSGGKDVLGMFTDTGAAHGKFDEIATLGMKNVRDAMTSLGTAKKLEKGEQLSWGEQNLLESYAQLQEAEGLGKSGIMYQTVGGVLDMIPYVATYGISNVAVYKPVQAIVEKAMTKMVPQSLIKAGTFAIKNQKLAKTLAMKEVNLPGLAVKWGSRSIGAVAQTGANVHSTMNYAATREMPDVNVTIPDNERDLVTTLDRNTGEKHGEALFKGFLMNLGDIGFEHSGNYIDKLRRTPGRFFNTYALGKDIPETYLLKQSAKLFGYKKWSDKVSGFIENSVGWHGPLKEYEEELATQIWQNATTGDEYGKMSEFLEQQLVTALTVSVAGMPVSLAKAGVKYAKFGDIGDDVAYIKKNEDGTKTNVILPKYIHDELVEAFNEDPIALAQKTIDVLDKYVYTKDMDVKMNKDQVDLILKLALVESQNKYQKQLLIDHLKSRGVNLEDYKNELLDTEESAPQSPEEIKSDQKTITRKQFEKIAKKNKKFEAKYPQLYSEGLLPRDTTGQYRDPDGPYLKTLLDQLNEKQKDLSEIDTKTGEYRINNEEYIKGINDEIKTLQQGEQTPETIKQIEELNKNILQAKREPSPELIKVLDQKAIVETELSNLADKVGVPWNYLPPSEKHERIVNRLIDGEKIEGTGVLNEGTMRSMLVTTKTGEQVKIYLNKDKESVMQAQEASRKKLPLVFQYEAKQDWNPDDKHVERVVNQYTGRIEKIPYGDRIKVLSDGKVIGAVEIHDYNEEGAKAAKYQKAVEMASNKESEVVNNLVITPDGFQLNEKEQLKLKRMLDDLVSDLGRITDMTSGETIPWLENHITNNDRLNNIQKNALLQWLKDHGEEIRKSVDSERFVNAGLAKKATRLDMTDWHFNSTDAVALSSATKLTDNLKTFFKLWQQIAEQSKHSREQIELAFHEIAMLPSLETVKDEATYIDWLVRSRNAETANEALIKALTETNESGKLLVPFSKMVSALQFYSNLRLIKQIAMVLEKTKTGIEISQSSLNPSETYEEFLKNFESKIKSFSTDNIREIFAKYKSENGHRFDFARRMSSEELYKARLDQHTADLKLLQDLTGFDWSEYFTDQTNETTQAGIEEHNVPQTNFGTYDNLMRSQAFRWSPAAGRFFPWEQSNLVFNLINKVSKETDDKAFKDKLINFFTKGKGTSFSNLYKLTTAKGRIGLNGQDVKGDTFSSFQQYSDFLKTADDIMTTKVDNYLVDYFKSLNKPIEIIIINGIHNRANLKNKFKKGTPSTNMSMEDIWVSLLSNFALGKDTYLQNIGQFADKPYLYQTYVPKVFMPSADQIEDADNILLGDFNDTVDKLIKTVTNKSKDFFANHAINYPFTTPEKENYVNHQNEQIRNFVTAFVYNYVMNQHDLNEIFFGAQESYKDINDLYKRAGSSNSPGYRFNTNIIGGVGKTYNFAVINDKKIYDKEGNELTKVGMDGYVFFDGDLSDAMQVSMGDIYSKKDLYPTLTTTKALISAKNKETNRRLLVKGNWYNVQTMADDTGSETVKAIRDFMKKNKIHVLGIGSSKDEQTKEGEKVKVSSVKMLDEGQEVQFFNRDGSVNENAEVIQGTHVIQKSWDDVFIQQDLRHSSESKSAKQPSQNFTTMLSLDVGHDIALLTSKIQKLGINNLIREFNSKTSDEAKREWAIANVNSYSQKELLDLLNMGLTVDDPVYRNMLRKIMASAVKRQALELPINRNVAIEIADLDNQLEELRKVTVDGVEHILLPDAAANIAGARSENVKYLNRPDDAIKHIREHWALYPDLYDNNNQLMEWEIKGRNGIIPGEYVFLTRVPNSGFSTFDVARLKFNMKQGNFAMINRKGQVASSSDFDGDQRYIQTAFKQDGIPLGSEFDDTQEGIANKIMKLVALDYTKPKFFDRINYMINTDAYDGIIKNIPIDSYSWDDPLAYQTSRLNNKVGLDMKGGMTNLLTVYSLLSRYDVPLRRGTKIARDDYGAIRAHMENFLTMFFDNQKDPKVERMGFNEITGNMFILRLIGKTENGSDVKTGTELKHKNFTSHYNSLLLAIEENVKYFTTPLVRDFIDKMRMENGGMRTRDQNEVFRQLKRDAGTTYTEEDVKSLRTFFSRAKELSDIKSLHTLTQEVPDTYAELQMAKRLVAKAKANSAKEGGFKLFDLRNMLRLVTEDGVTRTTFVPELSAIDDVIDIAENFIFDDVVDATPVGRQVYDYILAKLAEKEAGKAVPEDGYRMEKTELTKEEIEVISSTLNNVFNIRAIGLKYPFRYIAESLAAQIPLLKDSFPGNEFLKKITLSEDGIVSIDKEFTKTKIHDADLEIIKADFDKLPDDAKDLFATYQIMKYGSSQVTSNGGFYKLFGNNFKVELSKRARTEMDAWYFGDISPLERLAIADWVIRGNKGYDIRQLQDFNTTEDRLVNYYTDPSFTVPIHRDTMEGIESINDVNDFNKTSGSKGVRGINVDLFDWVEAVTGLKGDAAKKFSVILSTRPLIAGHLSKRRVLAEQFFPMESRLSDEDVQQHYLESPHMQMMLSYDDNLNTFIYNHLNEQFPGIQMFSNREAFYNYVRDNISKMVDVDMEAVGHSFKNAIFIDPTKPVQEAMFHEHTHIYWDNLPVDHAIKVKLRNLYSTLYDPRVYSQKQIDEFIITDIGRAGTDLAEEYMDKSILQKFLDYMREFWNSVKIYFGKYSKTDLVNNMAYAVWTNKGNIKPSSKQGDAHINNLVLLNLDKESIILNDEFYTCNMFGKPMPGITSVLDFFKFDKFDSEASMDQKIKEFERYWLKTRGKEATKEEVYEFSTYLEQAWKDRTSAGNAVHAISQEVFGSVELDIKKLDKLNSQFANADVINELRASLTTLKENIIDEYETKYNNEIYAGVRKGATRKISFRTELPIVSVKDNVFGFADLVVDLGDNHLLVFDLKSTENEYLNADKTPSSFYKKEYSFMMAPLAQIKQSRQVSHKLQLFLEAKILEDQLNNDNPGEKNTIDGLFIVPVITHLMDGKISESHVSRVITIPGMETDEGAEVSNPIDNIIPVNYIRDIAEEMLTSYNKSAMDFGDEYDAFKETLKKEDMVPWPVQEEYLKAFSYFRFHSNQRLNLIDHDGMEALRGNHFRGLYNRLLTLGYTVEDIKGRPAENIKGLSFEVLLNVGMRNISRVNWELSHETYYINTDVGSRARMKPNPDYIENNQHFYHTKIKGMDTYFHDAGVKDLKEGDRITKIADINYEGKAFKDQDFYTVVSVSKRGHYINIKNDVTKIITPMYDVLDHEGALKINSYEDAVANGMTEDNYTARFIETKESVIEKHWVGNKVLELNKGIEGEKAWARYKDTEKRMWAFFNKYNNIDEARKLAGNKDEMTEIYNNLKAVTHEDHNLSTNLMIYLGEGISNHVMANQIRSENADGPHSLMPMTLNMYHILTGGDSMFKDLQGYNTNAYYFHPTRKIFAENVGLNWILLGTDHVLLRVHNEQFDLRKKIYPFFNSLRTKNLVSAINQRNFWRLPSDETISKREKEFLDIIYGHYYKYVPEYIEALNNHIATGLSVAINGYPKPIPVDRLQATKEEMIHRIGRKWGGVIHDIMADTTFDHIKFTIDKKVVTLGELKDQFVMNSATTKQKKEWLGSRMQYSFNWIPWVRNAKRITKGRLYHYVVEARKIYRKGNTLNERAAQSGYRITALKDQKVTYETNHIMESQTKIMESNIWAYYMKDMIAPLDYVLGRLDRTDNAFKYLKDHTDKIMYHKSNQMGSEISQLSDLFTELTSLRFIAFSPKTQLYNFTVGQSQNFVREPIAMLKGLWRLGLKDILNIKRGSDIGAIIKAINILRSHGLGDLVDDARFDTLAKRSGITTKWGDKSFNFSIETFKSVGYLPMEIVERFNQIPVYVGLMTQAEWDSYNIDGSAKPGKSRMTEGRALLIKGRVQDVQGDYTPPSAAPAWNTAGGAMIMQFGKWAPTAVDATFMPYHLDRFYMTRSGMLSSIALFGKVFKQQAMSLNEKTKMEYMRKALLRWPDKNKVDSYNNWVDKTFGSEKEKKERKIDLNNLDESIKEKQLWYMETVHDYLQSLIVGSKNGTISLKQLDNQDWRNLWSNILKASIYFFATAALLSRVHKGKEEKVFEDDWTANMTKFILRYQSDMFLFAGEAPTA